MTGQVNQIVHEIMYRVHKEQRTKVRWDELPYGKCMESYNKMSVRGDEISHTGSDVLVTSSVIDQ